jgi:Restriction endonuclease
MSPYDFEDFIAQLFCDLGHEVQQTSYSGDYGADLIVISPRKKKIAIQIKRYAKDNNVGVNDVNQVIGARDYYKCNSAMIITTSDFTKQAYTLLAKTRVTGKNWDDLQQTICDTYLDGQDIYSYYPDLVSDSGTDAIQFEVTKIEYNRPIKRIGPCTIVYASIRNSGANCDVELAMPILITTNNQQTEATFWCEGYFQSGTIYSGASVDFAFIFRSTQVNKVSIGDRIIQKLTIDNEDQTVEAIVKTEPPKWSGYYNILRQIATELFKK